MGLLMKWNLGQLRLIGSWALAVVLRWPWLSPAVAILVFAAAGHLGVGWLIGAGAVVGFAGLAVLLALASLGHEARRVAGPTGP